jgi:hypothetical protein
MSRPRCRVHRPHARREIQTAREVETAGADHLVELTADLAHSSIDVKRIASDSAIQRRLPPLCRFSDAGMPRPSPCSGIRRPKSAKETSSILGVGITEGASFLYRDYFSDNQSGRPAGC